MGRAVLLFLLLGAVQPVAAAPCLYTVELTVAYYEALGVPIHVTSSQDEMSSLMQAMGHKVKRATRAVILPSDPFSGGMMALGFEVDGCLLPKIIVGPAPPPTAPDPVIPPPSPPPPGIEARNVR